MHFETDVLVVGAGGAGMYAAIEASRGGAKVIVAEVGPDHEKMFVTEITVGGKVLGRGEGKSKKVSEQEAAKLALLQLQQSE